MGRETERSRSFIFLFCIDVDECKLGLDDCGRNYECKNTVGLFKCNLVRCNEGYRLVDGYCEGQLL